MGVKEITQHWILSCDCCGVEATSNSAGRPTKWVSLKVGADAVDMYGHAAADASRDLLFCNDCGSAITKAVNDKAVELRATLERTTP